MKCHALVNIFKWPIALLWAIRYTVSPLAYNGSPPQPHPLPTGVLPVCHCVYTLACHSDLLFAWAYGTLKLVANPLPLPTKSNITHTLLFWQTVPIPPETVHAALGSRSHTLQCSAARVSDIKQALSPLECGVCVPVNVCMSPRVYVPSMHVAVYLSTEGMQNISALFLSHTQLSALTWLFMLRLTLALEGTGSGALSSSSCFSRAAASVGETQTVFTHSTHTNTNPCGAEKI